MTKLNPCPDCGREPDLEEHGKAFRVACWHCSSTEFITARSANGAVNAWNAATGVGRSEPGDKTLRDEFAAITLPLVWHASSDNTPLDDIAARAYNMVDAMLKERNK